jgi:hypothetical protein
VTRAAVDIPVAGGAAANPEPVQLGWRFCLGAAAVSAVAQAGWLLAPVASSSGWSTGRIARLSGAGFVANKIGSVTAIAILGKPGFNHLKHLLFGLLRKVGPPQ